MELLLLICLFIHIFIFITVYILIKTGVVVVTPYMLSIVLLVPLWGIITLLICDRLTKQGRADTKERELEELILGSGDFRKITLEEEKASQTVIPLEEAIRLNDTKVRRKIMMEIMRQDPGKFIKLLQQARLNDDMEVTHYASTAIMEVQRKYEILLQKYEKELQQNPEDAEVLDNYIKLLRSYINSGIAEDNMQRIQRMKYDSLLRKKMYEYSSEKQPYYDATENYIELGFFEEAEKLTEILVKNWPNDENTWIAKLKLYFESKNKEKFEDTLGEIKKRKIFISSQFRDLLKFWDSKKKEPLQIGF